MILLFLNTTLLLRMDLLMNPNANALHKMKLTFYRVVIIKEREGRLRLLKKKGGDCYQVAGRMIMDNTVLDDMMLVHGEVAGQGKLNGQRLGHAWIEIGDGDVAVDHSNGNNIIMRTEQYYKIGKITKIRKYTKEQAMINMLKYKHFGEWEANK